MDQRRREPRGIGAMLVSSRSLAEYRAMFDLADRTERPLREHR